MSAENKGDLFALNAGVPDPIVVAAGIEGDLRPKPKTSIGMSKKVIGFLVVVGAVLLVIFFISLDAVEQGPATTITVEEEKKTVVGSRAPDELLTDKVGTAVAVQPETLAAVSSGTGGALVPGASKGDGKPGVPAPLPPVQGGAALSPEEQIALKAKMDREARLAQARAGGLEARGYQDGAANVPQTVLPTGAGGANSGAPTGATSLANFGAGMGAGAGAEGGAADGIGDQEQKLAFIKTGGTADNGYHLNGVVPPLSVSQLNAGSYIPAVLGTAVNSDLPGQVMAMVRENVYASVRDRCLLIPSMSQLVGSYDSRVAIGQNRQLVVWSRVIFPNGNELNLAGMSSADAGGQAGLEADVDNHWFRLFGVALGMSAVTAGVALSVPDSSSSSTTTTTTPAQSVATALSQQFGQLGGQVMGKYLNIQPTLRNYPGERFNIIVPKNIIFPGCYR